jgi:hypothetical protein
MIPKPIRQAMDSWTANAVEQCRHSRRVYEAGLCYICMRMPGLDCPHFATKDAARAAMDVKE